MADQCFPSTWPITIPLQNIFRQPVPTDAVSIPDYVPLKIKIDGSIEPESPDYRVWIGGNRFDFTMAG